MATTEPSNPPTAVSDTEKCDTLPEKIDSDDALSLAAVAVNPLQPRTWGKAKKWCISILLGMLQFSV